MRSFIDPGRVQVLELEPELGAVLGHAVPQPNERSVADRLQDRGRAEIDRSASALLHVRSLPDT
jgi:hypothetical protein